MIYGAKKGSKNNQKPNIAPDSLVSTNIFKGLYGLCEGEIAGLVNGGKSIRLDDTPLINDNGQPNFTGVNWDFRTGTLDQSHIAGFPAVENETNIGVEVRHDRPFVRAVSNKDLSAVRVRLNFNALREQKDNGDITGYAIEYAIDIQTDGGAFVQVLKTAVRGKASQGFKRSHRLDLPKGKRWTLRVRRLTANRDSDLISDAMYVDALTEVIDVKLRYPATAMLGLSYNAETFGNIAKVAIDLKGKLIQIPSNYNPETRTYTGLWDGTFIHAYSNNPAWVFYDLCTHKRYGLGERLVGMVDKWRLYQIGQYCDEMVDDGQGGKEPRFAINVYIQKAEDAYQVLQNIASVFRGMSFWDGTQIVVDSDTPKDPVYTFSPANIVNGEFVFTGTRARDRHTMAKVAWDNPDNNYTTEYEPVRDEGAVAKYGIRTLDISAFGCTSKGQAQRAGLWALKSEQLETQQVSFKTGLQGFIPQVGEIINIADPIFAGRAISGRIMSVDDKRITLDRPISAKAGDTLTVNHDGVHTAKITAVHDNAVITDTVLDVAVDDVWAIISDDLQLMQFRVLSITQGDDATFSITALQYERQKYQAVDSGAIIMPTPYTVLNATPIQAPASVILTASTRTHQGQNITTLSINWEQVSGAVAYIVEWRKDDNNWQTLPKTASQSVDIDGVYSGNYMARVRAVDAFDNESLVTTSTLTAITGKVGKPPRLASISAKGLLFGMALDWIFNKGSDDTNFTEIQVSPDGKSNITTLGTFAYPTNKHEITGLQGNLTQFYRGRIVDKLGNTSDWTAWVKGTTDAQADKVLNLLQGQITASQLHQDLSTPIAKIAPLELSLGQNIGKVGSLETAVSAVNNELGTLNSSIAEAKGAIATAQASISTTQSNITKAQQDLAAAVNSITTERNRITSAVRDISTLQSAVNSANSEIASTKQALATAQSTLQTAVSNISTERNRITAAVRDITALQSANNAKTQELANLTQSVNGVTSSVRDMAVTTGDLSQRYTQLKTVSDKASSDITAIQQTQAGQATQLNTIKATADKATADLRNVNQVLANEREARATAIDSLSSRFDNLTVGGRNLLCNTKNPNAQNLIYHVTTNRPRIDNLQVSYDNDTMTLQAAVASNRFALCYWSNVRLDLQPNTNYVLSGYVKAQNNVELFMRWFKYLNSWVSQVIKYSATTEWTKFIIKFSVPNEPITGAFADLVFNVPMDNTVSFKQLKLETGTIATDYSPAPEDTDQAIQGAQANIDTLRETVTTADTALARRIDSLDSEYKSADTTIRSSVQTEITTRTNADSALSSRIDVLQSDYNGNKASIANQLKTLSDKDSSQASQISSLTANVATAQSTADDGVKRANNAQSTANTAKSTADNALSRANTANTAITAEQKARADADSSLASQISALDTAYKTADTQLSGRITTAQQTATNAQQAVATAQTQLSARIDGISVGGRNLLRDTNIAKTGSYGVQYLMTVPPKDNDDVIVTIWGELPDGKQWGLYNTRGLTGFGYADKIADGVWQKAFKWRDLYGNTHLNVYQMPNDGNNTGRIDRIKLERGTIATDYSPAPEDTDQAIQGAQATLDEFKSAQATKDSATAQQINTMQTTLNGNTASIQQHAQSLNGLNAQYTVKVQTGGIVAGIGLASSNGVSDFAVRADRFYIAPPTGGKGDMPFMVLATSQVVGGVTVPAGAYINSAFIQNGSITTAKIATASIDTAQIRNGAIGSIQLKDGAVTSAKIGVAQVDTLQLAGEAVIVPRVQFTANQFDFYSIDTEEEINRVTLDAQGGAVAISFGFERLYARAGGDNDGNGGRVVLRIKRGGTVLRTLSFTKTGNVSWRTVGWGDSAYTEYQAEISKEWITLPTILDKPPAGEQVYTVTLESRGLNAGKSAGQQATYPVSITARSLQIMGVKR